MASNSGDDNFGGRIGRFIYYKVNGKSFVRAMPNKRSKWQLENRSGGELHNNHCFAEASAFAASLRHSLPIKYATYSHIHSRLAGAVKEIIQSDKISPRGDFRVRKENLHQLNKVVWNDEFPVEMLRALAGTEVRAMDEKISFFIPPLPVAKLASRIEKYRVWVELKAIELSAPNRVRKIDYQEMEFESELWDNEIQFTFAKFIIDEDQGLFAAIGFDSLQGWKVIRDRRMNGLIMRFLG